MFRGIGANASQLIMLSCLREMIYLRLCVNGQAQNSLDIDERFQQRTASQAANGLLDFDLGSSIHKDFNNPESKRAVSVDMASSPKRLVVLLLAGAAYGKAPVRPAGGVTKGLAVCVCIWLPYNRKASPIVSGRSRPRLVES